MSCDFAAAQSQSLNGYLDVLIHPLHEHAGPGNRATGQARLGSLGKSTFKTTHVWLILASVDAQLAGRVQCFVVADVVSLRTLRFFHTVVLVLA